MITKDENEDNSADFARLEGRPRSHEVVVELQRVVEFQSVAELILPLSQRLLHELEHFLLFRWERGKA